MSPVKIELCVGGDNWATITTIDTTNPQLISGIGYDKYIIQQSSDRDKTTIYKSKSGFDPNLYRDTAEALSKGFVQIRELKKGDEPFTLDVITPLGTTPRKTRISHI